MTQPSNAAQLSQQLAELTQLSISELKERWRSHYLSEPHRRMSRELLTRALAYGMQEKLFGGLKPATCRLLERIAYDAAPKVTSRARSLLRTALHAPIP